MLPEESIYMAREIESGFELLQIHMSLDVDRRPFPIAFDYRIGSINRSEAGLLMERYRDVPSCGGALSQRGAEELLQTSLEQLGREGWHVVKDKADALRKFELSIATPPPPPPLSPEELQALEQDIEGAIFEGFGVAWGPQ